MSPTEATAPLNPRDLALSTMQLSKDYGDRPAVQPIDLQIPFGQHVALVGHNGSGKTTLLRMIAGLLDPSGGSARIGGHLSGTTPARAALSWLSDSPTFYDDLSLREHLEYVARLHGVSDETNRGEELLERLQLQDRGDDIPTTFSRGLRQKAAIAIALVRPFKVLLVDEPFVGLDEAGKQSLLELLDEAAADGRTLVAATHELAFVDRVQRLLALRDGELVYDGPPGATDVHQLVRAGYDRDTLRAMLEFATASASSKDPAALAATLTEKSADGWSVVSIVTTASEVTAFLSREGSSASASLSSLSSSSSASSSAPTAFTPLTASTPAAAEPAGWAVAPEPAAPAPAAMAPISTPAYQPATTSAPAVPAGWYADPAGRFDLRYWDGSAWTEHVSRAGQQYTDAPTA